MYMHTSAVRLHELINSWGTYDFGRVDDGISDTESCGSISDIGVNLDRDSLSDLVGVNYAGPC
jgi:hypothetical protein